MKSSARGLWMGMSLLVVALSGCWLGPQVQGSGNLVQEERELPGFVSLEVNDGIEATVVVDPNQPQKVRLVGDDNLLKLLRTEPLGSSGLRVYFQEGMWGWNSRNPLRVEMTVPSLEALSRSGGSTVEVSGDVSPASFSLEASGGGTVKVSGLDTESFSMAVSGGADVTLAGSAIRVTSDMSGGSNLRARALTSRDATLTSSGGGSTELRVSESLRVAASGGGAVRIIGRPTVLGEDLSGGSTLDFE